MIHHRRIALLAPRPVPASSSSPSRHALALLALLAVLPTTLPPALRADPAPPTLYARTISADTTESWTEPLYTDLVSIDSAFHDITLAADARLTLEGPTVGRAQPYLFISGPGALHIAGGSIDFLAGGQDRGGGQVTGYAYSGGLEISGGTLRVEDSTALGAGDLTLSNTGHLVLLNADNAFPTLRGFEVQDTSTLLEAAGQATEITGFVSGSGRLNLSGDFTLSAANTHAGGTAIQNGQLSVSADSQLGAADSSVTLGDGAGLIATAGFASSARELVLSGTTGRVSVLSDPLVWNGSISGPGQLVKEGAGTLLLSGPASHMGSTSVSAGTLGAGAAGVFAAGSAHSVAPGATLALNNHAQTIGGLAGAGSVSLGSGTLTVNQSSDSTFAGVISGTGGFTKTGDGALTLSGLNTHSGITTVNSGVLNTGAAGALSPDSTLVLLGGATVNLQGHDQTVANLDSRNTATGLLETSTINLGGATLTHLSRTHNLRWAGALVGEGDFVKQGTVPMRWSGPNTFEGSLRVETGTLIADAADSLSPNATVFLGASGRIQTPYRQTIPGLSGTGLFIFNGLGGAEESLTLNMEEDSTFSGVFSGSNGAGLIKNGPGTLTLASSNYNFYWGPTVVSAGTLRSVTPGSLSDGSVHHIAAGATLDLVDFDQWVYGLEGAGAVTLHGASLLIGNPGDHTFSGTISGTGGITKVGLGTQTLLGQNTYSGGTHLGLGWEGDQAGVLRILSDSALGAASGGLTFKDGTLQLSGDVVSARTVSLVGAGVVITDADTDSTFSGVISGPGSFTKTGPGALTLSGINTHTGITTVNGGVLNTGAAGALSADSTLFLGGGATLNLQGHDQTVANLDSWNPSTGQRETSTINLGGATLTNLNGLTNIWVGSLVGQGDFVKLGSRTMRWSGANTFEGSLRVETGRINLDTADSLSPNATVFIAANATVATAYRQTIAGLSGDGYLIFGGGAAEALTIDMAEDSTFSGKLSGSGQAGLTKKGSGTLTLATSSYNFYAGPTVVSAGTLRALTPASLVETSVYHIAAGATLEAIDFEEPAFISGLEGAGTVNLDAASLLLVGDIFTGASHNTFSGTISGTGGLIKSGYGTQTLSGANTYSGGTTFGQGWDGDQAGVLQVFADSGLGAASGGLTFDRGTLQLSGDVHSARPVSLVDYGVVSTDAGTDSVFSGVISGGGSLVKAGAGSLTLSGLNTHTGDTNVTAGTLRAGAAGAFSSVSRHSVSSGATLDLNSHDQTLPFLVGAGSVTLGSATLTLDQAADSTFWGVISGAGSLVKTGASSLTLSGVNTYAGGTTLGGGTVRVSTDSGLGDASGGLTFDGGTLQILAGLDSARAITLAAADATVSTDADTTSTFSGVISGPGAFTKSGAGSLTLSGANTYTGATTVGGGTLGLTSDASLGDSAGALTINGGDLRLLGDIHSTRSITLATDATVAADADTDSTFAGVLSGPGAFTKTGAGALTLSGVNTYAGATTLTGGTLRISADSALGDPAAGLTFDGGTLQTLADLTSARALTLAGGGGTVSTDAGTAATFSGVLSGAGTFTKTGAGSLTLSGLNTHTGATTVSAGTLRAGVANAFSPASAHAVASGATLDLASHAQTLSGLSGAGAVSLGSARLTLDQSADTTFAGTIAGTGGLAKRGAGTLTLSGANTYSGATTVSAGTLRTGAAGVLSANSAYFLIGGSTLDLDGHDQTVGDLDSYNATTGLNDFATVNLGGATLTSLTRVTNNWAGSLTGSGTVIKKGAATLNWYAANTFNGTLRIDAGKVTANAANTLSPNASIALTAGATLELNNHAQTIAGLSGAGSVTLGSAALTLAQGSDSTFSGVISGTGSLAKSDSGALTLSGANTYSGGTTLAGGTLRVSADSALGASGGGLTFNGGTLQTLANFASARAIALASGGGTVSTDADTTAILSGLLSGAGSLTKTGAGTLTLSGANTYSGATTVSAGTLHAGAADAFSSASIHSVASGATLDLANHNQTLVGLAGTGAVTLGSAILTLNPTTEGTFAGLISGTGGLVKIGSSAFTLSGANTYSGATTVSAGTLRAGAANAFSAASSHSIATGATLDLAGFDQTLPGLTGTGAVSLGSARLTVNPATDTTFAGVVSGTGGLLKTGPATLTLSGANTYSGLTTVSTGTLRAGAANAFGAGSIHAVGSGATLDLNNHAQTLAGLSGAGSVTLGSAALTLNQAADSAFSGVLTGPGSFTKSGAGTLTLSGLNTYTGATTVSAGTLRAGAAGAFGSSSGYAIASGATLDLAGFAQTLAALTGPGSVALGTATLTLHRTADATFTGAITGPGAFTKTGAATLTLSGANIYTGATTVAAGTLRAGAANTFGAGSVHAVSSGATLDLNNHAQTVAGLSGDGAVALGSARLTVQQSADTTFAGTLAGTGGLIKTGAGALTLSGANTYSGHTLVSAGNLRTGAADVLSASSAYFLIGGSTLDLDGHDQTIGDLDSYNAVTGLNEFATVKLGGATLTNLTRVNNNWAGSLTGNGTFVKKGATTMNWSGANTFAGTLQIDAGKITAHLANTLSPNATVTLAAGSILDLNNHAQAVAGLSGAGNLALGSASLSLNQAADSTFSGVVSGTGSLVKNGAGALTLSGDNTYSGGTTLRGGTLRVAADSALGASSGGLAFDGGTLQTTANLASARAITLANGGGTVSTDTNTTATFSGVISGPGALTKTGVGALILSGVNTYTGATTISAGTLRAGATGAFSPASAFALASGATLDLDNHAQSLAGLSGAGSVSLGSAALTVNQTGDTTFSGTISGLGGALTKAGSGALTLSGANTYSGGTTIAAGTLVVGHASALGTGDILLNSGGTLDLGAHALDLGRLSGDGRLISAQAYSFSGATDTTFTLALAGSARIAKSGDGTLTLAGANTYSGGTTLNAGTLALANDSALGSGTLTLNGGALRAEGGARTLANAAVLNADTTVSGTERLTLTGNLSLARNRDLAVESGATLALSGGIAESGGPRSLLKYGAGTLDLTGPGTYTGGTFIAEGTVTINNSTGSVFGSGAVTIGAGGMLTGAGAFSGALQNNGTWAPGNSPTLAVLSSFTQGSTGTLIMEIAGLARGTGYDAIDVIGAGGHLASATVGGTLSVVFLNGWTPSGEASFQLIRASSIGGTFAQLNLPALGADYSWNTDRLLTSGHLDLIAIPEPASAATLAGLGLLGFASLRRRRRHRAGPR